MNALEGEFVIKKGQKIPSASPAPPLPPPPSQFPPQISSEDDQETLLPPTTPQKVPVQYSQVTKNQEENLTGPPHYLKRGRLTPFSSLCEYPEGIRFAYQESDEQIILLLRRHFITNLPWIASAFLLAIIPPFTLPFLPSILPFINLSIFTEFSVVLFYYLALFGFVFTNFSLWYFQISLVTNKRVVDVDVAGVLFRHVSETKLEAIQDVSYSQYGLIRSIFNYGEVLVQTAGELPNFEFENAPNPTKVIRIVGDLIHKPIL